MKDSSLLLFDIKTLSFMQVTQLLTERGCSPAWNFLSSKEEMRISAIVPSELLIGDSFINQLKSLGAKNVVSVACVHYP